MAHEGEFSRSLSDDVQGPLRVSSRASTLTSAPARRRIRLGDRVAAGLRPRIFDHHDGADPRMAARMPSRTPETDAAPHNPERKLS